MSEAITEEQERVVSAARTALASFDGKPALFRWLENYSPQHGKWFWQADWHVVTREGQHWKIEIGSTDSDTARETMRVDGRAPPPPVMEHRPPKPQPVKARESSLHPMKVPSALEYIQHMLSHGELMELQHRLRERRHVRRPVYRSAIYTRWDEPMKAADMECRYEDEPISDRELMALAHSILDRRFRNRPPTPQPVRPAPPPTRRNQ